MRSTAPPRDCRCDRHERRLDCSSFERQTKRDARAVAAALALDPDRLVRPERYQPLLAHVAARGYTWRDRNLEGVATRRTRPDGTPRPPFAELDWFPARGLACCDPAILPATNTRGVAISDHEAPLVTIAPAVGRRA